MHCVLVSGRNVHQTLGEQELRPRKQLRHQSHSSSDPLRQTSACDAHEVTEEDEGEDVVEADGGRGYASHGHSRQELQPSFGP